MNKMKYKIMTNGKRFRLQSPDGAWYQTWRSSPPDGGWLEIWQTRFYLRALNRQAILARWAIERRSEADWEVV